MKIEKNFLMVSNYNADISWILDYTDNYIIYDRSDTNEWIRPFDPKKVIKVKNIGWDIYDKFTYIIDNYGNLPDSMILTKGNILKYITKDEFDEVCNNTSFTPLFTKHHKTYMPVCFYGEDGMFNEINNDWYHLSSFKRKYFKDYNYFLRFCFKNPAIPKYIKFAPGSNYIVPRENIKKFPRVFYENLRTFLSHHKLPGEAHIIERALYTIWTCDFQLNETMLSPVNSALITKNKIKPSIIKTINRFMNKKFWQLCYFFNKVFKKIKKQTSIGVNKILFRTKNFIERPFSKTQLSSKKERGQNKGKKISEILLKYDTDKVRGDKPEGHCYGESYDEIFSQFEDNVDLNLLEIGVQKGGSLLAWKEYFPKSNIYGVDIVDERIYVSDKVNFILSDIKKYKTDLKFDIIIDDGSHFYDDVVFVVNNFLDKLKPKGVLVIEDVQSPKKWVSGIEKILPGGYILETRDLRHVNGYGDDFLIIIKKI